jgi:hypothetical protein
LFQPMAYRETSNKSLTTGVVLFSLVGSKVLEIG